MVTNVDKFDEISTSKINFSLVDGVDGHFLSLVHGHRETERFQRKRLFR